MDLISLNHINLLGLVTCMAPKPHMFLGFRWAFISQTPVVLPVDFAALVPPPTPRGSEEGSGWPFF